MPILNTDLGEVSSATSPDTSTLVPGTGKGLKQGLRGLQQKKFKIGVKRGIGVKPSMKGTNAYGFKAVKGK